MFQPAHIFSSIIILKILSFLFLIPYNAKTAILSIIFHMLPDLDIFWAKKLHSHRIAYPHSPLFWIIIFYVFYLVNFLYNLFPTWVLYLYIIQVLAHLFFDFITARTGGIPLLYPFSKKEYSLFPLNKIEGDFDPFSFKKWAKFLQYYSKNKFLIIFELLLCILGIFILLIKHF